MGTYLLKGMQAVLLEENGGPLTLGQVPIPQPGPGQVLIRMAAAPINPSDLGFVKGSYGFQKGFPIVPGFEGSGTVVAAGSGLLPRLLVGKRVACSAALGGTWAEYLVASASSCFPLAADSYAPSRTDPSARQWLPGGRPDHMTNPQPNTPAKQPPVASPIDNRPAIITPPQPAESAACCSQTVQASCCEPAAKTACCGADGTGCGCR